MELRKDPITRSWVVIGHPEHATMPEGCPLCPGHESEQHTLLARPSDGPWQVRVMPHLDPLYRIETELGREAEGIYDRMGLVGAHEVLVETPVHGKRLSQMSDQEIEGVLAVYAQRIADLKQDRRFKYVTIFKNQGAVAGAEWEHAHSQITATTFVPRRILYELRASRTWFEQKERCVFCDIVRQEEKRGKRMVDIQGEYYAFCPYASLVPYEVWLLHKKNNHLWQPAAQPDAVGGAAGTSPAAHRKNYRRLSYGGPYGSQYQFLQGRTRELLDHDCGRLPLAHRNPANCGIAQQVLQH